MNIQELAAQLLAGIASNHSNRDPEEQTLDAINASRQIRKQLGTDLSAKLEAVIKGLETAGHDQISLDSLKELLA